MSPKPNANQLHMLEWAIVEILYLLGKKDKHEFFKYSHDEGEPSSV